MKIEDHSAPAEKTDPVTGRLVFAGFCVILLAGWLLQKNIRRVIEARNWYEHSLTVQGELQATLLRLERIDSLAHLYVLNGLWTTQREAQNLSLTVEANARDISDLVSDNSSQTESARQLTGCTDQLVGAMRALNGPGAPFPTAVLLNCREVAVLMIQQERTLAQSRNKEAENSKVSLTVVGMLLACFSILVVIALFAVLIRDSLFRRKSQDQVSAFNGRLAASNEQLAATIQEMKDRAAKLKVLGEARDQLQICTSSKDAYETTVYFVAKLLPESSGSLCMINNSRQLIELQSTWGGDSSMLESFPLEGCCAMRSGHARWRTPDASVLHCEHFIGSPPERYLCLPLMAHGETLGVLYVECASDRMIETVESHLSSLRDLLQLASMTVAALNLRSKLENQSIRDSLTGLFNRHFMEITLEREIRRASRRKSSMAVFMIDADNFKQFNDTFGHKAGDTVLQAVAERFLSSVRSEDVVCRYGGEEFVIILPDTPEEKASERAQEIREAIAQLRVTERGQVLGPVTVSIGVAMYPEDGRSIEELMQASDRSLYTAKRNGRNQVVFAVQTAGRADL